ncbi:MAG: adenosine deaminase [Candidatus Marinimicrobia bacterium]|nr:adenosine deaminase [Candidatus Neomarinimicrobiota bacterium]
MTLKKFIQRMPKVELHVHLEGSIQPKTLLTLAERNNVKLPAESLEEMREWYQFSNFAHFIEIYFAICDCIRTPDDFELIAGEFLKYQAEQNIKYSEVIFTPYTHHEHVRFDDQLAAINRARREAKEKYDVSIGLVPDLSRQMRPVEESFQVVDWAIENMGNGIIAFGLGGPEINNPPEIFTETFKRAKDAGLPSLPHAGETEGTESIWGAINALSAVRIGHGVRCLEDSELVAFLREKQIPLDVSPTSNVCLGVASTLAQHPLPQLLDKGLFVTINSDDPPMFDTTLTDEYLRIVDVFDFNVAQIKQFVLNGIHASLLPSEKRQTLEKNFRAEFIELENELGL